MSSATAGPFKKAMLASTAHRVHSPAPHARLDAISVLTSRASTIHAWPATKAQAFVKKKSSTFKKQADAGVGRRSGQMQTREG
jgi:hypothetical protein